MQNDVLYNRIMAEIKKSGGGGGGVMIIEETEGHPITETWKEITDAYNSGKKVILYNNWEGDLTYSEMVGHADFGGNNKWCYFMINGTVSGYKTTNGPDSPIAWSDD